MFLDNVAYLERKYVLSRQKNEIAKVKNIAQPWGKKEFGHKTSIWKSNNFLLELKIRIVYGPSCNYKSNSGSLCYLCKHDALSCLFYIHYRVPHGKVCFLNWLWWIEICKLDFFKGGFDILRFFATTQPVFAPPMKSALLVNLQICSKNS